MNRDDAKRRVIESTDLVRLIGEHVVLKPRGREFIGVCPFHDDSNPSMYVVPHKQFYHCFACGASGDAFSFVMNYHKMSFPEALQFLADRCGIELPRFSRDDASDGQPTERQRIAAVNQQAVDFFRRALADEKTGAVARQYITRRGISDEMVEAFGIGVAPDAWDALARTVEARRWDRKAFELAGLIATRRSGGYMDKLRHRLIFPIFDAIGRPIAFGGRVLPDSTREDKSDAKYLNSPETPLFNKSATLFGLNLAHKAISDSHTAIIVEGYTDVIAAHQAGVCNAVATLGTALTHDHAAVLRRYADQVILIFDADEAGQKAADRALQVFFDQPIDVKIAVLPGEMDPADLFAQPDGLEQWNAAVAAADDAMTFQFRRVRKQFDAADTITAKQRISEQYLKTLIDLGLDRIDMARRGLVLARVAEMLLLDTASVDRMIRRMSAGKKRTATPTSPSAPAAARPEASSELAQRHADVDIPTDVDAALPDTPRPAAESFDYDARPTADDVAQQHLVGCLLNEPSLFHSTVADGRELSESVALDDFTHRPTARIYEALYEWLTDHDQLTISDLRELLKEENAVRYALQLQIEVSRLTEGTPDALTNLLTASAGAVADRRAEREYQQHKMLLRETNPTNSPDGVDAAVERLALLKTLAPSARRLPRVSS